MTPDLHTAAAPAPAAATRQPSCDPAPAPLDISAHGGSDPAWQRGPTWELTPDLLAILDRTGAFVQVNPAWTATLGWSRAEMTHQPYTGFVHPGELAASNQAFASLQRGEPVLRFVNRMRCKDGSYRWLSWVAVPDGEWIHSTARDISDEKAASEERDRLWALSEDMLARADYAGKMSAVNPAWTQVLGYTEHQLLTRPYADIIHPDDVGTTVAALESMGRTGHPTRFENRILAATGEWKPIGWTVSPEPDGDHFIAVGRDLADYKARERELLQAQEQLRQSQKMEAVGQLTGGIAHDFNNLLGAISISLEMLTRRVALGQYDTVGKYVEMARGSVRRAAVLTQRLLAFSRRQALDPTPIDANRLIAGMEELVRRTVGPAVELRVCAGQGVWTINADASQLESALLNLCINARDAMDPDGGVLTIATANVEVDARDGRRLDVPAGRYIELSVTDTGSGMDAETAARAFDPFFTTKPIGQGTGLGLSMVYGFARQSGGQARIESTRGKGTRMSLLFPRHAGVDVTGETGASTPTLAHGHGQVVLVIDDEETIRSVIAEVLADSGYQVLQASNGPAGLEHLNGKQRIDLLVTDVGLPGGMNGRQVAAAARRIRPGLKILFITGYAENAAAVNAFREPGMHVLTKPFDMSTFAEKIDELIEA